MYYAFLNEAIVYLKKKLQNFQHAQSAHNFQISKRPIIRKGILRSDENTLCLTQVFYPVWRWFFANLIFFKIAKRCSKMIKLTGCQNVSSKNYNNY
jgi:hypothetical protein